MSHIKFDSQDITTLQNFEAASKEDIYRTLYKTGTILNELGPYFKEQLELKEVSKLSERLSANKDCHRDYMWFARKNFSVNYGFGWFLNEKPFVYLDFFMDKDNSALRGDSVITDFKKIEDSIKETPAKDSIKAEYFYKSKSKVSVGFKKSLIDFFEENNQYTNEENQHTAVVDYLQKCIKRVKDFKDFKDRGSDFTPVYRPR